MQPHKLEPKRQQRAEFLAEGSGNKKTKTGETTEPESAHVQSAIPSHFHVRIAFNPSLSTEDLRSKSFASAN